jgi:3-deoxy-7-phosphoheptulonate synthase
MLSVLKYYTLQMSQKPTYNLRVDRIDPLPTPESLYEAIPISDAAAQMVLESRQIASDIINGRDKRLLAIIGPCSIHDTQLAYDYAKRLQKLHEEVKDSIYIVMRVYFEKPRTVLGWKGLINDPHLDGTFDVVNGLGKARQILSTITEMGLPTATEMLDPVVPQYLADFITWSAIGARTTESQTHRQMASGLSMPVGLKNGTTGDLLVAINAIQSCSQAQQFLGINHSEGKICVLHTTGNPDAHIVLRGGSTGPNYDKVHIEITERELEVAGINTGIMIDCNHANSNKDPYRQPDILQNLVDQKLAGNNSIIGFMIESHIHGGSQAIPEDLSTLKYGVSVTDKCLDWEATEACVREAAKRFKV